MKKLITSLAVIVAVTSAFAANINWTISGNASTVANDYLGNAYAGKAYLILASNISGLQDAAQEKATFETTLQSLTLASADVTGGLKPNVSKQLVESDSLVSGTQTTFGFVIVSEDADGNGYFKIIQAKNTPWADGTAVADQKEVKTGWLFANAQWQQGYTAALDPGPGGDDPVTPPIPEPATGALALAGLAMLFRRKRA